MAASAKTRDDFSESTKRLIAQKSGYICAYPGCKRMTIASSEDRLSELTMVGVAAHITAASIGGPRYDKSMGSDERKSESNGLWTCQLHGKLIDDNASKCTTLELHRWKKQHEDWVFSRVASGVKLLKSGIYKLSFNQIGIFTKEQTVTLSKHNVLFGNNESGKTTFCEILSAFSGSPDPVHRIV